MSTGDIYEFSKGDGFITGFSDAGRLGHRDGGFGPIPQAGTRGRGLCVPQITPAGVAGRGAQIGPQGGRPSFPARGTSRGRLKLVPRAGMQNRHVHQSGRDRFSIQHPIELANFSRASGSEGAVTVIRIATPDGAFAIQPPHSRRINSGSAWRKYSYGEFIFFSMVPVTMRQPYRKVKL